MIKPSDITALIDTREQTPVTLEYKPSCVLKSEKVGLYTGDYSIKGLENHVAIERKSLADLMGCIGTQRERFEKEIIRLKGYEGTLMGWIADGIPVTMAKDHKRAGIFIARILWITANRRARELRNLNVSI